LVVLQDILDTLLINFGNLNVELLHLEVVRVVKLINVLVAWSKVDRIITAL
jgi:hypothetical protein